MTLIYISHWRFPSEKTHAGFAMKTCEEFAERGLRVELWCPKRNNSEFKGTDPYVYYDVDRKFTIRYLPVIDVTWFFPGNLGLYLLLFTFNISIAICALFHRSRNGAIFYFHDARDAVLPALFVKKIFFEVHDFYKSRFRWINQWSFSRASGFIVTNRIKINLLQDDFQIPVEKILYQPNVVDFNKFAINTGKKEVRQILNLPIDQKIALYAGHLFDWKGADILLEAAKQIQEGNFQVHDCLFVFVGGTDSDIQRFRKESAGYKNIMIIGRRPHGEIPLWLRAADVLVLPNSAKSAASKYETSPVKLFEYMASDRPIAAANLPSLREIVDDDMAWFFEPDNSRALAEAVSTALSSGKEAAERAERARRGATNYTWEKRAENILTFVKRSNHEYTN